MNNGRSTQRGRGHIPATMSALGGLGSVILPCLGFGMFMVALGTYSGGSVATRTIGFQGWGCLNVLGLLAWFIGVGGGVLGLVLGGAKRRSLVGLGLSGMVFLGWTALILLSFLGLMSANIKF